MSDSENGDPDFVDDLDDLDTEDQSKQSKQEDGVDMSVPKGGYIPGQGGGLDDGPERYQAVPSDVCSYGQANYWDDRYMEMPDQFEWYHPYNVLRPVYISYLKPGDKVLIVGCGNSQLAEDLHFDGYENITCCDFSRVVTEMMKEEYSDIPNIEWHCWNVTCMDCPDEQFDVVIDKACMDAIMCSNQGVYDFKMALNEVERVLKPEGIFLMTSCALPEARLEYMEDDRLESKDFMSWDVLVHAVPKPAVDRWKLLNLNDFTNYYYIYVCLKNKKLWMKKLVKLGKRKNVKEIKVLDMQAPVAKKALKKND